MKVAAVQMSSQADVAENLRRAELLVSEAGRLGADLVCLPEGFAFLGRERDRPLAAERLLEGPVSKSLQSWSRRFGVHVLGGGMPECSPDAERPYNTSVLFSPGGELQARYRKIHLFDVDLADGTRLSESRGSTPGEEVVTAPVGDVGLGLSICYDVRFPELYAKQRLKGAKLLSVPAAFTHSTGQAHWHVLLRARAIETQCFLVAPAQDGTHPYGRRTFGHSLIVDPWGDILAEQVEGEGVIVAEVDPARADAIRAQMPVFSHRRPLTD